MKKIVLTISVLLISAVVHNRSHYCLYIMPSEPIKGYSDLIYAINMVEARIDSLSYNIYAYNEAEGAIGAFQIRQCRLDEYNRLTGNNIMPNDLYDYNQSLQIFIYFARAYGNDYEKIAKRWNGSGPMTEIYWQKVKAYL